MKSRSLRLLLTSGLLLASAACGGPSAPPPALVSVAAATSAAPVPTFTPVLASEGAPPRLVAREPGRTEVVWSVATGFVTQTVPSPDGGAYAIAVENPAERAASRDGGAPGIAEFLSLGKNLVRIGPRGERVWSTPWTTGKQARFTVTEAALYVTFDDGSYEIRGVHEGAVVHQGKARFAAADASGLVAVTDSVARVSPRGEPVWKVSLAEVRGGRTAAAKPMAFALAPSGLAFVGLDDGSIFGFAADGHATVRLALAGAVRAITPRPAGDFIATTARGTVVSLGPDGAVRWKVRLPSCQAGAPLALADGVLLVPCGGVVRALSPDGTPLWVEPIRSYANSIELDGDRVNVLSERPGSISTLSGSFPLAGPHSPTGELAPTAAYRAELVASRSYVLSLVALGPDDVWVLAGYAHTDPHEGYPTLLHYAGGKVRKVGPIRASFRPERFGQTPKDWPLPRVAAGEFSARGLARSARGTLLALGWREQGLVERDNTSPGDIAAERAPCVLEWDGSKFHERRELFEELRSIPYDGWSGKYATNARGDELLCFAKSCVQVPSGGVPSRAPAGAEPFTFTWGSLASMGGDPSGLSAHANAIWAGSARDVWQADDMGLRHFDGRTVATTKAPFKVEAIGGTGPDDAWIIGDGGAAHFDGKRWERVLGVPRDLKSITAAGPGDAWVATQNELWHLTRATTAEPAAPVISRPGPEPSGPPRELSISGVDASFALERVELAVPSDAPLTRAFEIASGPNGLVWLRDDHRVIEVAGEVVRRIAGAVDLQFDCYRCLAPRAPGEGSLLAHGLLEVTGGQATRMPAIVGALTGLARTPSGDLWLVSASQDDGLPHAVVRTPRGLRVLPGFPSSAYVGAAAWADDDVWLAGGAYAEEDAIRPRPVGEGLLVHFDGRGLAVSDSQLGEALLSVAAAGPGEAWAAGAGGALVHAGPGRVEAWRVERSPRLWAIAAPTPNDVWIAGAGSTLLRFDGETLRRIDASRVGPDAALTGVVPPSTGSGWLVGPSGIFRIVARPRRP